jgi:biopolymer transport protein ExbB
MNQLVYYFQEGGLFMWPLLLCSLVALALVIERAVRLRRSALIDPAVVDDIQSHVEQGNLEMAASRHHSSPVLVGRILSKGLEDHAKNGTDIDTALLEAADRRLHVLHANLSVLNMIAKIAPLIGLIGTVQGMIMGFEELEHGNIDKGALAHAIRIALITTFAGLFIAIPTLVAISFFRSKIRRLQAEFEEVLTDVAKSVRSQERRSGQGPLAPSPALHGPMSLAGRDRP